MDYLAAEVEEDFTGCRENQVAHVLGQSVHTTYIHMQVVFSKSGVQNRVELMAL